MNIECNFEYREDAIKDFRIEELAQIVLTGEECPNSTSVSITFIANEEIATLNENYRGIIGPTDVLSFECDGADTPDDPFFDGVFEDEELGVTDEYMLGDIFIAPDIAEAQADTYGQTFEQEIDLLCVHGLLHLCGYDHIKDSDAEEMQALEKRYLACWAEKCKESE